MKNRDKHFFSTAVWALTPEDGYRPRYRREAPPVVTYALNRAAAATPPGTKPPCVVVYQRRIYVRGATPWQVFRELRYEAQAAIFRHYLRLYAAQPGVWGSHRFSSYVADSLNAAYRHAAVNGAGKPLR